MKVNSNQIADDKPAKGRKTKKEKKNQTSGGGFRSLDHPQAGTEEKNEQANGNVYAESFKAYKEKLKTNNPLQQNKTWFIILGILFLLFVMVNSNMSGAKNQLKVKIKRTTAEVESLNSAIAEVKAAMEEQARIESIVLSTEEEELAKNDAKVQGNQIAYIQNQRKDIRVTDTSTDEELKALQEKADKINKELDPYFSENDKTAGKNPWYQYLTGEGGIPGTWEFATNAAFKGTTSKVLWLCYADDPENPDDHSLLAYCTAQYDAETQLFSNVNAQVTTYALNNLKTEEGDPSNNDENPIVGSEEGQDADLSLKEQLDQLMNEDAIDTSHLEDGEMSQETLDGRAAYREMIKNGEIEGEEYDPNNEIGLQTQKKE